MENLKVLKEIEKNVEKSIITSKEIVNAKYYHNTDICNLPLVLEKGILTFRQRKELAGEEITEEEIYRRSDPAYPTGVDGVSVAYIRDLREMYRDEWNYDPYSKECSLAFRVSSDVNAYPDLINYFNEAVILGGVKPEDLKAIEIRLLKELRKDNKNLNKLVDLYNYLIDGSKLAISKRLDLIVKDMDYDSCFDMEKIASFKKIRK